MTFFRTLSWDQLRSTLARFPLAILSAAFCSGLLIWTAMADYGTVPDWVNSMTPSLFIGILLFGGLSLFAERHGLRSLVLQLLGIPVLYLLIYSGPTDPWQNMVDIPTAAMVFVASLALVFVGAYVGHHKEEQGFWSFGILTWSRAMVAIASALIFVIGFNLAIYSIQELFNVDVGYQWPQYLMYFFCVFVASLVFYTGLPTDYKALQKELPYDKGTRAIALYLSFPLLTTYFLILTAYVVKILITQVWPDGFVAMPVLLFTLLGFGTYALLFPQRGDRSSSLIRGFTRFFPWVALPFLLVYFVAFWKRIEPYGLTELRYLGVLLGLVLLGWSLYFATQKKASLRWIPLSLVIVGFVCSFGPWSPRGLSIWSQKCRLEKALTEAGVLVDGQIVPATGEVSDEVEQEISSKVDYFVNTVGTEPLEQWMGSGIHGMDAAEIMDQLGLEYKGYYFGQDSSYEYFNYWTEPSSPASITGYDYAFSYYGYAGYGESAPSNPYSLPNGDLTITLGSQGESLLFDLDGQSYEVALGDFLTHLKTEVPTGQVSSREDLSVSFNQGKFKVKVYFNSIDWSLSSGEFDSLNMDTDIYLSVK